MDDPTLNDLRKKLLNLNLQSEIKAQFVNNKIAENPKRMRLVELGTSTTQSLSKIKNQLIKIENNALEADYFKVRELRLKLKDICEGSSYSLSRLDRIECYEIKRLLTKLKQKRPVELRSRSREQFNNIKFIFQELCSHNEYINSQQLKSLASNSQFRETTFDRTALEPSQDVSRNFLTGYARISQHIELGSQTPECEREGNMRKTSQQTPVADATDDVVGCTEEDETAAKIRQYRVWAKELRYELEKRN